MGHFYVGLVTELGFPCSHEHFTEPSPPVRFSKIFNILKVCVCARVCVHTCVHVGGGGVGQRITSGSWFSSSALGLSSGC